MKILKKERNIYFIILIFFYGLIFNIGPIGEIHSAYNYIVDKSFFEYLFPRWQDIDYYVLNPLGYYLDYGYAKYLSNNIYLTSLYKTIIVFSSFVIYQKFFERFLNFKFALLLCLIIFLSPNSDSLIYSSTHRYLLGSSLVLLSYLFICNNKHFICALLLFLSILICYISIIFTFGIILFFLIKKKYHYILPYTFNFIIFVIYYFLITSVFEFSKFNENYVLIEIFYKSIIIFVSYFDAGIGISFIIKIFSIFNEYKLAFFSLFIIIFFFIINLFKMSDITPRKIKFDFVTITLLISFTSIVVFILSFGYPFIVFGLGNRTNLFINIFSYSIFIYIFIRYNSSSIISLCLKLFFSIILTSGIIINFHWKNFSNETEKIINSIEQNCLEISNNDNNKALIFLLGYRYSKLDKFDHIEFLAPPWVANSFCDITRVYIFSISNEILFEQSTVSFKNTKYFTQHTISNNDKIYIVDLINNNFQQTDIDTISKLNKEIYDIRHWYIYSEKLIKIIKKISNEKYK